MHEAGIASLVLVAVVALLTKSMAATACDRDYGAYLAGECTSCHRADGRDQGIPSIVGWEESEFIGALRAFQSGRRQNPVMRSVATSLGDDEIAALACFFAVLGSAEDRP